ncbi:3-deoxy-7-phosphoheptulonate synthase [Candidatus Harpocratesius sp.]
MNELKFEKTNQKSETEIKIKEMVIGNKGFMLAAGPCAIESQEQYFETAKLAKQAGANVIRGSVFKPRTSPYSFQGMGKDGLKLIKDLGEDLNIVVETEVTDPRDVSIVKDYVDIIRIGARNMQNFDLLKEVAKYDLPIILKRGLCSTYKEFLYAAEYLMMNGNEKIILCERGIRTFEPTLRNTLDLAGVSYLKKVTHLPIIVDPSHATGKRELIIPMSKAAIAAGSDGLIIEVHNNPEKALCDGAQSLTPEIFKQLVEEIKPYLTIEKKKI